MEERTQKVDDRTQRLEQRAQRVEERAQRERAQKVEQRAQRERAQRVEEKIHLTVFGDHEEPGPIPGPLASHHLAWQYWHDTPVLTSHHLAWQYWHDTPVRGVARQEDEPLTFKEVLAPRGLGSGGEPMGR